MSIHIAPSTFARGASVGVGSNSYKAILNNPKYQELVRTRNGLAVTLSIAMLVIYLAFILLVAFDKPLLAAKVAGGTTSVGIVLGLVVIVLSFVLTAVYVARANGRFDELADAVRREASR